MGSTLTVDPGLSAINTGSQGGKAAGLYEPGETAGLLDFLDKVKKNPISDVLKVAGENVEVMSAACENGATISIRRWGQAPVEAGRVSVEKGVVSFEGAYTREVRTFFEKKGWPNPNKFLVNAQTARLPVDEYMISELKNYFQQKFGPQKTYAQKTQFVFENAKSREQFMSKMKSFFGEEGGTHSKFSARWNSPEGPFGETLGELATNPAAGKAAGKVLPVEVRKLPEMPSPKKGEITKLTVGESPPGSRVSKTSHSIMKLGGKTVAIEMPSCAYAEGVDIIAVSHSHADHFNPGAVARQLQINQAKGMRTTILSSAEVQGSILPSIAEADGWSAASKKSARQFLTEKYSLKIARATQAGKGATLKMISSPFGSHGTPNAGFLVSVENKPIYFYSGDGDFNIESLKKQLTEVKQVKAARAGAKADEALLAKYKDVSAKELDRQAARLNRQMNTLSRTHYVSVDTGTTGFDTHGNASTKTSVEQMRPEGKGKVMATHEHGYGPKSEIPNINEGKVEVFQKKPDGSFAIKSTNRIGSELFDAGAEAAKNGEKALTVEFEGTKVRLKDGPQARGAIKRVMEKYSTTMPDGKAHFELGKLKVENEPALKWLENRKITPKAKPAPKSAGKFPAKPATYMGFSTEIPPWAQHLKGKSKALFERCAEVLKHGEKAGLSPRQAQTIRNWMRSPSLITKVAAAIEGSPKLSALFSKSSKVAGKLFAPAFAAFIVGYELHERGKELAAGDKEAWSETAGNLTAAAAGIAGWMIDLPFAAGAFGAQLGIQLFTGGDAEKAWDNVKDFAFPVTSATKWAVTGGLKTIHGVKK